MQSINRIKASDGSGNASIATVQNVRSPLASTIVVDTVQGIPAEFIGSMGTPHTFIDPVTSEEITVISEATAVDFAGHIDGSDIEIDEIAPGYIDGGSEVGDIVIIRPTTQYADNINNVLDESHEDDGSLKESAIVYDPLVFDHIASGGVLTGTGYGSTLAWSLTEGVVYINGRRYTFVAATGVVSASKDTYFDLLEPASGSVATLVFTGGNSVANNAASPALAANSVRLAIIQSGANIASVAAINQGQEIKVLPIVSSIPYTTTDSLGNLICPRDPERKTLGFRRILADFGTGSSTVQQVTGLTCPVKIPDGRKIKINFFGQFVNDTSGNYLVASLWDGAVNSGTKIDEESFLAAAGTATVPGVLRARDTPGAGLKTYNVGLKNTNNTNFVHIQGAAAHPAFIEVELA